MDVGSLLPAASVPPMHVTTPVVEAPLVIEYVAPAPGYVRSSVDQRDSAASTRTQMRQSAITGPFQATQRCRMKFIIAVQLFAASMRCLCWIGNQVLFRGTAHVISIVGSRPTWAKRNPLAPDHVP